MSRIFRIDLHGRSSRSGKPVFINFECHHVTVADLVAALDRGDTVVGKALYTHATGTKGVYAIHARRQFALRKGGYVRIEEPLATFVEDDGRKYAHAR